MKRVLGLDYGSKRIGVAVSDPLGLTAQSLKTIQNGGSTLKEIQAFIQEYTIQKLVVGLPKNQHGEDSPKSLEVRAFCKRLAKKISCPICFWDERYSTQAVTRTLQAMGLNSKKQRKVIDAAAAAYILQGWLDSGQNEN